MFFYLLLFCLLWTPLHARFTHSYSHEIGGESTGCVEWECNECNSFSELLVSWNGKRPRCGEWSISLAVRCGDSWSPYIPYMCWGCAGQQSLESVQERLVRNEEDILFLQPGFLGEGFRIKVESHGEAPLDLWALHACCSHTDRYCSNVPTEPLPSVHVANLSPLSQMALSHPRCRDLCSPTSTCAVANYLKKEVGLDPATFCERVRDQRLDIYGNWVLNVAQASSELGEGWRCRVARLEDFAELHAYLQRNQPVVVSVKGSIEGAPLVYRQGHLMVVVGYDASQNCVEVVDPAFDSDALCTTSYPLESFLEAWGHRKNLTYLFTPAPHTVQ